ncbi:hypothetical protein RchiOBHm_Chr2g0129411 [Rosa chinensis]|uniref:Uncharacterized protein n=1 Tax=Rosa chinensis TaxID=74649 RepID=A0A2P6RUJ5_ROSCH|nr:hypothetical protein RchiOBHm_Chr2g0129411 [Rosa chinensis]
MFIREILQVRRIEKVIRLPRVVVFELQHYCEFRYVHFELNNLEIVIMCCNKKLRNWIL